MFPKPVLYIEYHWIETAAIWKTHLWCEASVLDIIVIPLDTDVQEKKPL